MPEMPETATQADYGAEIYRLVCRDCHGDHGQGLTDEWRAKWAPEDQNCWQSGCHAGNHPPEGFLLPRYVPPLLGSGSLSNYKTAFDVYNYMRVRIPWHTPGSLQDWEYIQLTAFLARERDLPLEDRPLDEESAAKLLLHP
jgi:cytochrome c